MQLYVRSKTGIASDGSVSNRLPNATAFRSYVDMKQAIDMAAEKYIRNPPAPGHPVEIEMDKAVGGEFLKGDGDFKTTNKVTARFKDGKLGMAV